MRTPRGQAYKTERRQRWRYDRPKPRDPKSVFGLFGGAFPLLSSPLHLEEASKPQLFKLSSVLSVFPLLSPAARLPLASPTPSRPEHAHLTARLNGKAK